MAHVKGEVEEMMAGLQVAAADGAKATGQSMWMKNKPRHSSA